MNLNEFFRWLVDEINTTFIFENRYKAFLTGIQNTFIITIGALIVGILIGTLVAVVRVSYYRTEERKFLLKVFNWICSIYLAIFRGTPIVVQLLIMYYVIFKNLNSAIAVAVFSFGINSGAYVAEIIRAGIMAVDIGQTEAGRSLGLPPGKTMTRIVLPQAFKNILPAIGNECITLLKETSVAGYITVMDITRAGEFVRSRTMDSFSLFFVAIFYFIVVMGITGLLRLLERRLRKGDRS